jgi:hypothetical protein
VVVIVVEIVPILLLKTPQLSNSSGGSSSGVNCSGVVV